MHANHPGRIPRLGLAAGLGILSLALTARASESASVELLENTPNRIVLRASVRAFDTTPVTIRGTAYVHVAMDREGTLHEVGLPELPQVCCSLQIPDDARMQVRVLSTRFHDLEGIRVAPSKGAIVRTVDPASVPYTLGPIYGQDTWWPERVATSREPYLLRDVRGLVVEIRPFQWNPARQTLRVYDEVVVEVAAIGPGMINVPDRSVVPARPDRNFESIYRQHFLNYQNPSGDGLNEYGDMLIICHGPFLADMQPFLNWKNSIGIPTTIVDVGTIGNTPGAIASTIQNAYAGGNLAYVLLVGDDDQVASPTYMGGYADPTYATITPDDYPDILVGRFSAQTSAQVQTQVERTIEYEQAGHDLSMGGWNDDAMGIASNQGPGHYNEYDFQHMNVIRGQLQAYGCTTVDQIYDPSATKQMIKNGLEAGRRFVDYCGHGSQTSWGTTGWNNNDINNLQNDNLLPVISSVACVNGDFSVPTCFAEAWLRATHNGEPTGAVAVYMSSINQYWNEPMYGQANHGYDGEYSYIDLLCGEAQWSVAGLWFAGSCTMMDLCGSTGVDMYYTWICFGDPSLCVVGPGTQATLTADAWSIPVGSGASIQYTVQPGAAHAGDNYLLLGSVTGTSPGTPMGNVVLPLNFDAFTNGVLSLVNSPLFQNFFGTLDQAGQAVATFDSTTLAPISPNYVGISLHFAALVWPQGQPFALATNATMATFVP